MEPTADASQAGAGRLSLLVVCTGNICRSPMAGALLEQRFASAGIAAAIVSAGLAAADEPVDPAAAAAVARLGGDVAEHRSRRLEGALVGDAALILGMERLHVREVVVLDPDAWPRTFTLKELVRRGERAGRRTSNESLDAWLARMHAGRRIEDLLGASPDDDVADPRGGDSEDYEQAAAELDDFVARLVRLLAPPP